MLTTKTPLGLPPEIEVFETLIKEKGAHLLANYLATYKDCFVRKQQLIYFQSFIKGLLSDLERKTIEPIASAFLGEIAVRGMQQFFTRSKGWDEFVRKNHHRQLAQQLAEPNGLISVDERHFTKKGKDSAGVAQQYSGILGKKEGCQAGIFVSYASDKGTGLVDSCLHLPEVWFTEDYQEKRKACKIPPEQVFKTKTEIANEMISDLIEEQLFNVKCIGCCTIFGSNHTFLDNIPHPIYYFASVRESERIFYLEANERPIRMGDIVEDESIPWVNIVCEGTEEKEPLIVQIKSFRCKSSRKKSQLYIPKSEIWGYIRKHEDGSINYFISNMEKQTEIKELDRLARARLSVEQCFYDCHILGMSHYETRSYQAWHRHMLLVMIAALFITILRDFINDIPLANNANSLLEQALY